VSPPDPAARDQQAILGDLVRRLPGYAPELAGGAGAARAVLRILARYQELLGAGLARVPERSFLAFLDRLGTELLPAQAARAPLVFSLVDGSPVDVTLPALSQVAATLPPPPPSLGDAGVAPAPPPADVVFATEQSITLSRSKLLTLYSIDPGSDTLADHSARLTTGFSLFEEMQPCEHAIYLGHDQLFALSGEIAVILGITLDTGAGRALATQWEYLTENGWLAFTHLSEDDTTAGLRNDGQLMLRRPCGPDAKKETYAGRTSFWIRGRLATPLLPEQKTSPGLPVVNDIRAKVQFSKGKLAPEAALADNDVLDVSKPFLPYGAEPATRDVFYLASREVFQRKGAQITLHFTFAQPGGAGAGSPLQLEWEFNDGSAWKKLGYDAEPGTDTFEATGNLSFPCPPEWGEATVGGVKNYWLRVRLAAGNYGLPLRAQPVPTQVIRAHTASQITVDDTRGFAAGQSVLLANGGTREVVVLGQPAGTTTLNVAGTITAPPDTFKGGLVSAADGPLLASTLMPPIIDRLELGYSYVTDPEPLDHCLAFNDFVFDDVTEACRWPDQTFVPFRRVADRAPTVHFGFARALPVGLVSLFADVAEGDGSDESSPFIWEYWSPRGWTELAVVDQTIGFTRGGLVQLVGAPDAVASDGLGGPQYRVRARVKQGQRADAAPIRGVWLNAVWATHSRSFQLEPLGNSDGNPRQTFSARNTPVLAGETVWVEEWTGRGDYWRTFVLNVADGDLRFDRDPATGEIAAVWVRWQWRPHLHDSGPLDRHYALERARGMLRFGDGVRGLIPPAGRRLVISYSSGGGLAGNVPAGAITELRTAVPFIQGATNPVAATGGAAVETVPAVEARGPERLRHRGRALAARDFAWLAREASPAVARARCLPITGPAGPGQRGWVTVLVVPQGAEGSPLPSPELRRRVRDHLAARAPATVARRIRVEGPRYVPIGVVAEVIPLPAQSVGALEARLRDRLNQFLHPLTGGPGQVGWDFGQTVHLSQIASVIEGTSGVDFAREIHLDVGGRLYTESVPVGADMLIAPGAHELKLVLEAV
jgi:hypothetical protein